MNGAIAKLSDLYENVFESDLQNPLFATLKNSRLNKELAQKGLFSSANHPVQIKENNNILTKYICSTTRELRTPANSKNTVILRNGPIKPHNIIASN